MKIAFLVFSPHGDALQDVEWCEHNPLGGSETAALRMAADLRGLGQEVTIITHPAQLRSQAWDVFVSLRSPDIFESELRPGTLNYLWCHDDVDQPQVSAMTDKARAAKIYDACDGVIVLSHYQLNRFMDHLHLPLGKAFLTTNGIPRARFHATAESLAQRPPWAFYASTPFRGLELLLELWSLITEFIPAAELHVCSSMKVYKAPDADYARLYDIARGLRGCVYHGSVSQAELRKIEVQCRVLAYPCVFPEISCIVAMEAMAAGCVVASTALGAMAETAWHNPLVPLRDAWADVWVMEVAKLLIQNDYYVPLAKQNLVTANYYDWNAVAQRWLSRFHTDLALKRKV